MKLFEHLIVKYSCDCRKNGKGIFDMLQLMKQLYEKPAVKWTCHTGFYLMILLILFFMYGFHTANTGSYIYNDF
jgi:D-Ala-teichoic acid biosynthesis protein.